MTFVFHNRPLPLIQQGWDIRRRRNCAVNRECDSTLNKKKPARYNRNVSKQQHWGCTAKVHDSMRYQPTCSSLRIENDAFYHAELLLNWTTIKYLTLNSCLVLWFQLEHGYSYAWLKVTAMLQTLFFLFCWEMKRKGPSQKVQQKNLYQQTC